jgi:oxygen-independent coproporphyrinogen-3 oxidase
MPENKSMYFHIPFCSKRCSYCDFTTYSGMEKWIPQYFQAIQKEVKLAGFALDEGIKVHTIFFGGGTPSIVPAKSYQNLLKAIGENFMTTEDMEVSLEANPGTIKEKDLCEYRDCGFNRISLGVQSFNEGELRLLGRIHKCQDTLDAVDKIRKSGFENLNLDLIYGLPGQSISSWKDTMAHALDLNPEHLSMYCLTLEEGTPLFEAVQSGEIIPMDDDDSAQMYELAMKTMTEVGYRHYEISNWARVDNSGRDYRCLHNLQYWKNEEYYGFGAGAHAYINNMRVANDDTFPNYTTNIENSQHFGDGWIHRQTMTDRERMQDEMMLGLRLVDEGISSIKFYKKFGREITSVFDREISKLIHQGLIHWNDEGNSSLSLTERGILLGNQVFMEFVGD